MYAVPGRRGAINGRRNARVEAPRGKVVPTEDAAATAFVRRFPGKLVYGHQKQSRLATAPCTIRTYMLEGRRGRCSWCSRCCAQVKPAENLGFPSASGNTRGWKTECSERSRRLHLAKISEVALHELPQHVARWLPDRRAIGHRHETRNLRHADRIAAEIRSALVAFPLGLSQTEAASQLAE